MFLTVGTTNICCTGAAFSYSSFSIEKAYLEPSTVIDGGVVTLIMTFDSGEYLGSLIVFAQLINPEGKVVQQISQEIITSSSGGNQFVGNATFNVS